MLETSIKDINNLADLRNFQLKNFLTPDAMTNLKKKVAKK